MSQEFVALEREAGRFYRQGKYQEAALAHGQARHLAQRLGMTGQAFAMGVWEAVCWNQVGHYRRGLALLLELLQAPPPDAPHHELWQARQRLFELSLLYNPRLPALRDHLSRLVAQARESGRDRRGSLSHFACRLALARGDFPGALRHAEQAWQHFGNMDVIYSYSGERALISLARLGRMEEAWGWQRVLEEMAANPPHQNVYYQLSPRLARVELLLARAPQDALPEALGQARRQAEGYGHSGDRYRLTDLSARVALVQTGRGDPLGPGHPARRAVAERFQGRPDFLDRFDHRLLLADFRLAALRHALGMPPAEDMYYHTPQQLPADLAGRDRGEAGRRRDKARAAVAWAGLLAAELDERLECTWYGDRVRARGERLAAMAGVMAAAWGPGA